jgi:hypothetical protein
LCLPNDNHTHRISPPWGTGVLFIRFSPLLCLCKAPPGWYSSFYISLQKYSLYHETEPLNPVYFTHDPKEIIASKRTIHPIKIRMLRMMRQITIDIAFHFPRDGILVSPTLLVSYNNSCHFYPDSFCSLILIYFYLSLKGYWIFTFKINTISKII